MTTFRTLTHGRIVSALWQVFLLKQVPVPDGKDKVLAMWIRDVITSYLGRRAPFFDVVAHGCARVLMSARSLHVLAVSSSFKLIVSHGESSKRLATPRNTKDKKHLQSTQSAQPTNHTDQAPSTTERTARETHNTK